MFYIPNLEPNAGYEIGQNAYLGTKTGIKWVLPSSIPDSNVACTDGTCLHPLYYQPINIFLNPFDGHCTYDCT